MAEASAGTCAIAAIENPVSVILSSELGGRLLLPLEPLPWLTLHSWPFRNHIQAAFLELRLLVATDPRAEHQPLSEMSHVNLPAVALGNTDSPLCGVAIAILCNNRGLTCWV